MQVQEQMILTPCSVQLNDKIFYGLSIKFLINEYCIYLYESIGCCGT